MNRLNIFAGAALLTILTAGGAAVAVAQSTDAAPATAGTCQVTVDRSQAADSFRVDHQTLQNGDCVCYVYTGPETQGASTEARVADVVTRRECGPVVPGAPVAAAGGSSLVPLYVAGGIGAAGAIVAISNRDGNNNDSTGG